MAPIDPIALPLRQQPVRSAITHVAIGVFDGFHRGHQQVVARLLKDAASPAATAILTFEPHPLQVIAPERAPKRLTTAHQKRELLLHAGVAEVITLAFDTATRELSAGNFITELHRLLPRLHAIGMGPNWSFGKDRTGNAALLADIGREEGFTVHEIPPLIIEGQIASSTRIREAIAQRDFPLAALLLGRPYAIEGRIIHGDGRGRTLGFPTANLAHVFQMLPPPGVYACRAKLAGNSHLAVLNIGNRPTFGADAGYSVEAHLLNFSGDLYDQTLELADFRFLREEKRFPNLDALKHQIALDIVSARQD